MKKKAVKSFHATGTLAGVFALITCLPCLLAPLLISAGLSSVIVVAGRWFTPLLFVLVGLSIVGFVWSWRHHRNPWPLLVATLAVIVLIFAQPANDHPVLSIVGGVILMSAVATDWYLRREYEKKCACEYGTLQA